MRLSGRRARFQCSQSRLGGGVPESSASASRWWKRDCLGYLLRQRRQPISRPRPDLDVALVHFHVDLVKAAFILVVGIVADEVLAVDFNANVLNRFLQRLLLGECIFRSTATFGENLRRIIHKDGFGALEDLNQQRNELRQAAFAAGGLHYGGGSGRNVGRQRRSSRRKNIRPRVGRT